MALTVRAYTKVVFECLSITPPSWIFPNNMSGNLLVQGNKVAIIRVNAKNRGVYECSGTDQDGYYFIAQSELNIVGMITYRVNLNN